MSNENEISNRLTFECGPLNVLDSSFLFAHAKTAQKDMLIY